MITHINVRIYLVYFLLVCLRPFTSIRLGYCCFVHLFIQIYKCIAYIVDEVVKKLKNLEAYKAAGDYLDRPPCQRAGNHNLPRG